MTQNDAAAGAAQADASADQTATVYTAYEIDFMLDLRQTDASEVTREQIGIRRAPEEAAEFVSAAVSAGLRARGKVERSGDGQWLLGREGQIIAAALTNADRWLGVALAQGSAMRMAFIVKANEAVIMLTQDELDTFQVTALAGAAEVPQAVSQIAAAFLRQADGNTVSLRRTDAVDPSTTVSLMFHVEDDGGWKIGHLPLTDEDVLTVSDITREQIVPAVRLLWDEGRSEAPSA